MRILISACLLGLPCRYDGCGKVYASVEALAQKHTLIPYCPECYGGLPTPREPAEIQEGQIVVNRAGDDVTRAFRRGAEGALQLYRKLDCHAAVLKEKSPSCGRGQIYDGTFSQRLTQGNGITAALLLEKGIPVYGETELAALLTEEEAANA